MLSNEKSTQDEPAIASEIENMRATLAATGERIAELEQKLRMARGTSDITRPARQVTVAGAVETALREQILALPELAKTTGAAVGRVAAVLKELRGQKKIYNLGTEDRPRWTWRVGDVAAPEVLNALVRRLVSDQPLATAELVAATGARATRVSGAIVAVQRSGAQVIKLGARWFLPEVAVDARLAPKAKK